MLYASHAQFTQTNVVPNRLGDGIGGVTEHEKGRVVLPFAAGLGETDHVLGHELVHAFQRDILKRVGPPMSTLPLWFIEGMAEYLSVGTIDTNTAMWLRDSVEQQSLPRLDQLDDPSFFPYRYGQALWVYLAFAIWRRRGREEPEEQGVGWRHRRHRRGRRVWTPRRCRRHGTSSFAALSRDRNGGSPAPPASTVLGGKSADSRLSIGPTLSPDGARSPSSPIAVSTRSTWSSPIRRRAPFAAGS